MVAVGFVLMLGLGAAPAKAELEFQQSNAHSLMVSAPVSSGELRLGEGSIVCESEELQGTSTEKALSQIELELFAEGCKMGPFKAHLDGSGCAFVIPAEGPLDLACEGGAALEITPTFLGSSLCTLRVLPGEYAGMSYANKESGGLDHLRLDFELEGLNYEETGGGCGIGSGSAGEYEAQQTLKSYSTAGKQGELRSVTKPIGIFHAETAHALLKGNQEGINVLELGAGNKAECNTVNFTGTRQETTSSELTLTPTYSGCTAFGFANTHFTFNSCDFVLKESKILQLACPESKDVRLTPTLFGFSVCTVVVPGGEFGSLTYDNVGTGSGRYLRTTTSVSGIKYEELSGGSCGVGSGTNGTYAGTQALKAENTSGGSVGLWVE